MEHRPLPGLAVEDDPSFHVRSARVARVARWAVAAFVVAAALGVFGGNGPLLATRAEGEDGFAVVYDRFGRLDAPLQLRVTLPSGVSTFTLTGELASQLQSEAVSPAPAAEVARADGTGYRMESAPEAATVTFQVRPLRFGRIEGAAVLDGGQRLPISILVYP